MEGGDCGTGGQLSVVSGNCGDFGHGCEHTLGAWRHVTIKIWMVAGRTKNGIKGCLRNYGAGRYRRGKKEYIVNSM